MNYFSIPIDISPEDYAIRVKKLYLHWISHAPQIIIARLLLIIIFVWSLTNLIVQLSSTHESSLLWFFNCIASIFTALYAPQLRYCIFKKKKLQIAKQILTFYPEKLCIKRLDMDKQLEYNYSDLYKIKILDYGFIFYLNLTFKFTRVCFMCPVDFFTEEQLISLKLWLSKQ